jgi:hypothetical protein
VNTRRFVTASPLAFVVIAVVNVVVHGILLSGPGHPLGRVSR